MRIPNSIVFPILHTFFNTFPLAILTFTSFLSLSSLSHVSIPLYLPLIFLLFSLFYTLHDSYSILFIYNHSFISSLRFFMVLPLLPLSIFLYSFTVTFSAYLRSLIYSLFIL